MTSKVLSTHCNSGCKNLAMKRKTKVWTGQKNALIWCPYQKKLTRPFWDMETLQCLYWQPWKTNFSVHIFNLRYEESGAIFLIRVSIQLKICKIFIGMAPSKTKMSALLRNFTKTGSSQKNFMLSTTGTKLTFYIQWWFPSDMLRKFVWWKSPLYIKSFLYLQYLTLHSVLLEVGNFPNSGNFQGLIGTEFWSVGNSQNP